MSKSENNKEGGLGVSRVAGLANYSPLLWDLCLNRANFRALKCVTGCGFGHLLCSNFGYFTQNSCFIGFQSM